MSKVLVIFSASCVTNCKIKKYSEQEITILQKKICSQTNKRLYKRKNKFI